MKRISAAHLPLLLPVLLPVAMLASPLAACGGAIASGSGSGNDAGVVDATLADQSVKPPVRPDATPPPEGDAGGPTPFDGGPEQPLSVVDLGTVMPGTPVTFEIPAGTLGFHITAESKGGDQALSVKDVRAPSGELVHRDATPFQGVHATSETFFGFFAAAQVPQSNHPDAMPTVTPGTWTVVFGGSQPVHGLVQIQSTPDGAFHGGNLDLHVYIPRGMVIGPSAQTIAAGGAWSNSEMRGRIEAFFSATEDLYGLHNGTVQFHDIPAKYTEVSDDELGDVFKESRVAGPGQALHVFFGNAAPDSEWWGIASGIPGAANAPGSDEAGIAIAMIEEADAEMEGFVLAHEAGHYFGLNHTTEFSRGLRDPLEDTPQCDGINPNDPRTLQNCPDFANIMFPAGAVTPPVVASPMQQRVMAGSPIYKAFTTGPVFSPKAMWRPKAGSLDYGRLFGHAGTAPTPAEQLVLLSSCRHPSHPKPVLRAQDRAELLRLARAPGASRRIRTIAARLAASP